MNSCLAKFILQQHMFYFFSWIKKVAKKSRRARGAFRHRDALAAVLLRGGSIFPKSVRLFFRAAVLGFDLYYFFVFASRLWRENAILLMEKFALVGLATTVRNLSVI
jgi:hypothetical protein